MCVLSARPKAHLHQFWLNGTGPAGEMELGHDMALLFLYCTNLGNVTCKCTLYVYIEVRQCRVHDTLVRIVQ